MPCLSQTSGFNVPNYVSGTSRVLSVASLHWLNMDVPIPAPAECEVRSVIKFLNAQGIAPIGIDRQLCQVYGPNVMSKQMVRCSSVMMVGLPLRSSRTAALLYKYSTPHRELNPGYCMDDDMSIINDDEMSPRYNAENYPAILIQLVEGKPGETPTRRGFSEIFSGFQAFRNISVRIYSLRVHSRALRHLRRAVGMDPVLLGHLGGMNLRRGGVGGPLGERRLSEEEIAYPDESHRGVGALFHRSDDSGQRSGSRRREHLIWKQ
ncbi:hypothetical protein ANN_25977 [Periplaneta americana]|uniref:Uncharacterized protein n=1 Tax=Periplaneta americana TaxID=6978 RepID=A0ABQ8S4P3_PERAM|nr:hypothetical protein ANN_25977 [Periplaneta americana]